MKTTVPQEVVEFVALNSQKSSFFNSLHSQYLAKGFLSENQIKCVLNAIDRENNPKPQDPEAFTIKAGEVIRISKGFAKAFAQTNGFKTTLFNLEVVAVDRETPKAWRVKVKGSGIANGYCCACGLMLTDPISIQNNIGPVCAGRLGVSRADNLLMREIAMAALEREVTTDFVWIPKSVVKERYVKG